MKILVQDMAGLKLPVAANPGEDAAYDIYATTPPMIHGDKIDRPIDGLPLWKRVVFIEYGTNLCIAPEDYIKTEYPDLRDGEQGLASVMLTRYHTELFARSSISKYNLALANSVATIDSGYRNQLFLRFKYLFQPEDYIVLQEDVIRVYGRVNNEHIYQQGDRIAQIKARIDIPITFEVVKTLPPSKRNLGGFGSSGK